MKHALSDLQPTALWDCFYQLTQVPRPSKHEDAIQAFILELGRSLNLDTYQDDVGNITIKKPATPGYENCKGVILQAHLDMVTQANNDTVHDFENDPINAYVDGDWVTAKGTTLGADNGIGVAAIMAVLSDTSLEHGHIEALLTADEEMDMTGVLGLKADVLQGEILLNLDSEYEKELCIGCAGSIDGLFTLPLSRTTTTKKNAYTINVGGLRGGHSGVNIHQQRANANKLMARFLNTITPLVDYELVNLNGGNLLNAIPRETTALILADESSLSTIQEQAQQFEQTCANEFSGIDSFITLTISNAETPDRQPLTSEAQKKLLAVINTCPNGVYRMSADIEGLVETSSNLAVITLQETEATIEYLFRSSVDSARDDLTAQLASLFLLVGGSSKFSNILAGWQPNTDSEILRVMHKTGEALFGHKIKEFTIHAGLECGILGVTYPQWDMISFGPTIHAMHSPDEKVHIGSVEGFYDWLLLTLKAIPEGKIMSYGMHV